MNVATTKKYSRYCDESIKFFKTAHLHAVDVLEYA